MRYLSIVVRYRKFVLINVVAVTITALILLFTVPPRFTATGKVLPVFETGLGSLGMETQTFTMMSLGLIPFVSPSELYANFLKSRTIKENVIRQNDLLRIFKAKNMDDALIKLGDIMKIDVSTTGIIEIRVTHEDPKLAARIVNSFIDELDRFNREAIMTKGKEIRQFIEKRLEEVIKNLKEAEESLSVYQKRNKIVSVESELESIIKNYAELKAREMVRAMDLEILKRYAGKEHPKYKEIEIELQAIRDELKKMEEKGAGGFGPGYSVALYDVPEVGMELARRLREVEVQSELYTLIMQRYEEAKIMEHRDTPTIQIIERASPPTIKSWPRKSIFLGGSLLLGFIFGSFLAFLVEWRRQLSETNPYLKEMLGKN